MNQLNVQVSPIGTVVLKCQQGPNGLEYLIGGGEVVLNAVHLFFHFLHFLQPSLTLLVPCPLLHLMLRKLQTLLKALPCVRHVSLQQVARSSAAVPARKGGCEFDDLQCVLQRLLGA